MSYYTADEIFGAVGDKFVVNASSLNLRSEPSMSGKVLGKAPKGAILECIAESGNWMQVEYNGVLGWGSKQYLQPAVSTITFDEGSTVTAQVPSAVADAAPSPAPAAPAAPRAGRMMVATRRRPSVASMTPGEVRAAVAQAAAQGVADPQGSPYLPDVQPTGKKGVPNWAIFTAGGVGLLGLGFLGYRVLKGRR